MSLPMPALSTAQDYFAMPDDANRYELIEGRFELVPGPLTIHQKTAFRLARPLADHVERLGLGTVLIAPLDVVLDEHDVVQPDIIFVSRAHEQRIVRRGIEGAPDLVVEVLSDGTSSRDCIVKRDLYARSGIGEYWIVDPQERSVMVLVLEGGNYRVHCHARSTARIGSVVLPELELVPLDIFD